MSRTFVGFGFGAIQSGLFLYEAFRSGNFDRLVVAEVVPDVVAAVRRAGGYTLNIATSGGIEQHRITGVEIYNPSVEADRVALIAALAEAQEIATALPSVDFFERGNPSVAALMREAFSQRSGNPAVVYTGENNNHAAEILEAAVGLNGRKPIQFLNTVIGKMSGVVTDPQQIACDKLAPMTPGSSRAFLVEKFNRILITQITLPEFKRGIDVFEEKADLFPFEAAKLYGHNATHALLGYLANERGCIFMSDAPADLTEFARAAFLEESGAALIKKYAGIDPLFTPDGFKGYVDDLMERMLNPYLRDQVERVIRDPVRKLGCDDRLIGTMRLCLSQGVIPEKYANGVCSALRFLWNGQRDLSGGFPWEADGLSCEEKTQIRALIKI
ncbi:MAG: hypothetical protein HOO88_08470 [Kiritimatiellaceae bacterium]|nr:hypothetical protein [Kiritimatiellaceae bacterium]